MSNMGGPDSEADNRIQLRRLTPSDLLGVLQLAASVGWGLVPQRVLTFLYTGVAFGHEQSGRLISSAFHFRFSTEWSFVGLVIVHPDFQGRGVGREVLRACMSGDGSHAKRIALIATDAGEPLYASEGFVAVERLNRFMGRVDEGMVERWRELATADWAKTSAQDEAEGVVLSSILQNPKETLHEIAQMDSDVIGAYRENLYRGFIIGITECIVARDRTGRLAGFGMATRFGDELMSIGPLMAKSDAVASELALALIGDWRSDVRFDVPESQSVWSSTLLEVGIPMLRQSPVMVRGDSMLPGRRQHLFSIMDAAVG